VPVGDESTILGRFQPPLPPFPGGDAPSAPSSNGRFFPLSLRDVPFGELSEMSRDSEVEDIPESVAYCLGA
jgi:hypothetical protein